jgi:hypothetical protein
MMSRIDSRHWAIYTGRHFQNGHHNTAQIQHCPISTPFHMWVDYNVSNWFLTLKNFYRSPFSKWHIIIYPHMKCRWNRTMLKLCGIAVAILKMATGRNFSMSGINSRHYKFSKWPPQYRTNSTSWIDSRHRKISTGLHFQNGHHNTAKIQHCSISKESETRIACGGHVC